MDRKKVATVNEGMLKIPPVYLFDEVKQAGKRFATAHPGRPEIIDAGIGNTILPLVPQVVEAGLSAVREMGTPADYKGYGPENGYNFLQETTAQVEYRESLGLNFVGAKNIFINTGAKELTAMLPEIFNRKRPVIIADPIYPVNEKTCIIGGRRVILVRAGNSNSWLPEPPKHGCRGALIIVGWPTNPTGQVATLENMAKWVAYAQKRQCLLIHDAAYNRFVSDPSTPVSIFQVPGAWDVAVEFISWSKWAGFTNVRCAAAVIGEAKLYDKNGESHLVRDLWARHQNYRTNGVFSAIQKMAEAALTVGREACLEQVSYYMNNAQLIGDALDYLGLSYTGGRNISPYLWVEAPVGMDGMEFCDLLIKQAQIVVTPGAGFGAGKDGDALKRIRISSFMFRDKAEMLADRLRQLNI